VKNQGGLTRRRLAAALALPLAARPETPRQDRRQETDRHKAVRSAAAKLRRAQPGKNVSPAFRFIP
jgi:hypothetical protein